MRSRTGYEMERKDLQPETATVSFTNFTIVERLVESLVPAARVLLLESSCLFPLPICIHICVLLFVEAASLMSVMLLWQPFEC